MTDRWKRIKTVLQGIGRSIPRRAVLIALLVFFAVLGLYHDKRTTWGSNDFDTYFFAGSLVTSGQNLYTHEAFKTTISPYLYLPLFAMMIAPLTFLGIRWAALVWYLMNIGALLGTLYFTVRLLSEEHGIKKILSAPFSLKAALGALFLVVWVDNVSLAQVDFMIFFLVTLFLFLLGRGRSVLSGVVLALAAVIKIYPAYLVIYLIAKRRFKALLGFALAAGLFLYIIPCAVLGQQNYKESMKSWLEMRALPHLKTGGAEARDNYARFEAQMKPKNQALSALTARYTLKDDEIVLIWKCEDFHYQIPWPHGMTPRQVDILTRILLGAVFFITFLLLDYGPVPLKGARRDIEYSLVMLSMLLLFPMIKSHTVVPMLFPVALLVMLSAREGADKGILDPWTMKAFWTAVVLYVLQAADFFLVFGVGTYSLIILWAIFIRLTLKCRAGRVPA